MRDHPEDARRRVDYDSNPQSPRERFRLLVSEADTHIAHAARLLIEARHIAEQAEAPEADVLADAQKALHYAARAVSSITVRFHDREASSCFALDSRIATPSGPRLLSSIREGDSVLSWSDAEKSIVSTNVAKVSGHEMVDVFRVEIDGGHALSGTRLHPVRAHDGWTRIRDVRPGMRLLIRSEDGQIAWKAVTGLFRQTHPIGVGSIITRGNNTYFVDGVLAHSFVWFRGLRSWMSNFERLSHGQRVALA